MVFKPADQREANILAQLYPPFKAQLEDTLQKCREAGLAVYIFEGMRTVERQRELYAKGRDTSGRVVDKRLVVTNAKPGSSFHNYGLGADLVFDGIPSTLKVDWSWSDKMPWDKMGQIAQGCGLEWAGKWRSFPEKPHVQLRTGLTVAQFQEAYKRGGLGEVWKLIDAELLSKNIG